MKILNPTVLSDIEAGRPLKLDIGCGESTKPSFYGLDIVERSGLDILADLNEPLDLLPDDCVGEIYTRHTLEHVQNLIPLLAEFRRITRPDGRIEIIVPHFSNPYFYSDPTHVRYFGLYTMYYFVDPQLQPERKVPAFYSGVRFEILSIRIAFYQTTRFDRLLAPIVSRVVNRSISFQDWYERRLSSFFHAWEIRYVMRPVK